MVNLISDYLKDHSRHLHDAVEKKFNSRKIFDKSYTLEDYKNILWFNYVFHLHFENAVFEMLSVDFCEGLNMDARRKLPLLKKDLEALEMSEIAVSGTVSVSGESEALGILYVMEGSTLGGNVIMRQLSANPEFEGMHFHYFGCYGDKTGMFWKNFKDKIDANLYSQNKDEVLAGTLKAYQFLLDTAILTESNL